MISDRRSSNIISKCHEWAWSLPLLFFIFLPFRFFSNLSLFILVVIGIIYLVSNFNEIIDDKRIKYFISLFLCFYIPMLLSLPDAINHEETLRKILSFSLFIFIGIAIINLAKNNINNKLLYGIGFLLIFWTVDALWQYYSGFNILHYPLEELRLTGIFHPKHRIGIVMAILSPIFFEFVRMSQKKCILSWILIIPFITVILLGGSRASWVMLFISGILYAIYIKVSGLHFVNTTRSLVLGLIAISIVFVPIGLLKPSLYNNAKSMLISRLVTYSVLDFKSEKSKEYNALLQRAKIWESGLRVIPNHWINGIGVRGFRYLDKKNDIETQSKILSDTPVLSTHPHQITLEILVETGSIGLIGYLIFWILLFRKIFTPMITKNKINYWPWFIAVIVVMFPLNMHKSFYGHFSSTIIWVLIALAVASYPIDNKKDIKNTRSY